MQIKKLVQHGNSLALVIEQSILQAAGIDENCLFELIVDSNKGITIQSVKPINDKFEEAKNHVLKEYSDLLKRLSDR